MQHPDCARYRELLEQEFADVFQLKAINQEDPDDLKLRGDYGVCHIELVEGAIPKAVTPYRCVGVRAAAFKALIKKLKGMWHVAYSHGKKSAVGFKGICSS